jgi:hypothetical protein
MRIEKAVHELLRKKGLQDLDALVVDLSAMAVNMAMSSAAFADELDRLKIYLQEKEDGLTNDLFDQIRSALVGV